MLHIEIQGQKDSDFEERMFIYHYRIFDRYHKPVMSIAILTDDGKNWRPRFYQHNIWGCKLSFEFIIVKLLDYADKTNDLMQSTNPFAMVIKIQLAVLQIGNVMEERYQVKLALTRALYKKGYCKEDIFNLYSFIDWLIQLPEPLEIEYNNEVQKYEEEQQMAYITSAERFGIQKGMEQGMKQGIEQGIEKGELRLLQRLLAHKFGEVPAHYYQRLEQANADELLALGDRVLEATKVEDVFL